MKNFRLKQLLVAVVALLCSVVANAHDFEVDGICYNITSSSGLKVEVTYKGSSYPFYNEYSGAVEIPERVTYKGKTYSVTSIGEEAFYNCEVLKSVTVGSGVTSIGNSAFYGCSSLTSIVVKSGNTKYDSRNNCNAIIETSTNTLIQGCKNTIIPNSVTSIGYKAFYSCDGLTSITIPNSVTSIGNSAFYSCDGLTSINIPNSVTSIGESAFSYCSGLTNFTIGSGVTSIGKKAFYDCDGLTSIVVKSGNTKYDSRNNCNAIIETSTNTLIQGCKNTKIPNSVTSIGERAFYSCDSLTSIVIPNSVTSIGGSAFSDCSGLTSINIPNSVTSIGGSAFSYCYGLTSINIPNSVTSIGSSAFSYCYGLISINIPNSVTSIGSSAFCYCYGLTSVTIPNSVTSIGSSAFESCSGLTSVIIGSGVTSIGSSAFSDCKSLKTVINFSNLKLTKNSLDFGNIYHDVNLINISDGYTLVDNFIFTDVDGVNTLCGYIGNDTEIVLPDNYKGENYIIRNYVFNDCIDLTSVTVGSGVTSIGSSAFSGCSSLKSIVVKSGNTKYDSRNNCNAIIETATNTLIAGCKNTKIPNSVTNIGSDAFHGCSSLTSVTIPNSVTSIESGAFHGCSSLTSVTIPNSVTSIGKSAFFGCSSLTSVTIGNSVTNIGREAFYGCKGLKNVAIGNGVKKIESMAFYYCDSLENVYITDLTAWCNIEHGSWSNPLNYAKNFYLNKELLTDIVIPQDVTEIKREAFVGYYNLKSVTIGDNVTSYIGDLAFQNCVNLKSIKIGKNITGINNAFFRCTGITNIEVKSGNTKYDSRDNCNAIIETATNKLIMGCKNTIIPSSVISIGGSAFSDCKVLTSIVIPNSVTSIGGSAFSGCTGLKNVTIGKGVKKMEKWAFYNCDSLENVYIADLSAWCNIEHGSLSNPLDYAKNFYLNEKLLTDVVIPQDVTKLKDEVFIGYYNLKNVSIGDNISLIGGRAFQNCVNLNSVKIGKNVTSIGENAFNGCEKLISVYLLSETPKKIMNDNSFSNYDATLYVPKGALDAYRAAEGWKKFTKIIEYNPTDIEDIAEDAPVFKVTAGGVSLSNAEGEAVAVYTTGGALVEKIDCYAGGNIVLGKGVYIISVGGKAVKIKL